VANPEIRTCNWMSWWVISTTWKASILLLFLAAASQAEQVTTDKGITADPAKPASAPASAPGAGRRWTLATDDTVLTLGVTERGEPAVYELKNRQTQANWIDTPSVFPLIEHVQVGGKRIAVNWKFQRAETDETNGTRLTLRFACDTPGLEFASEWWSRPGRGPIRHAAFITNRGDGPVVIGYQATVALALTAPRPDEPSADPGSLWMWHFSSDGSQPHPRGVFREKVTPNFGRVLRTDPYAAPNDPIPLVILDLDARHGVYVGIEWSYGDMRVRGLPAEDGPDARLEAGNVFDFSTSLAAGQRFDVPPGFIGAYAGDVDAAGMRYAFRSMSMGAPEWFIGPPDGGSETLCEDYALRVFSTATERPCVTFGSRTSAWRSTFTRSIRCRQRLPTGRLLCQSMLSPSSQNNIK